MAEETFVAAGKAYPLDAFEQYIRGITEPDQAERLRHLEQAVKLSPEFGSGVDGAGPRGLQRAAVSRRRPQAFAKVGPQRRRTGLEAGFYRGLSLLFSGDYPQAEQAFADVARVLPLAEVVNNEGVAVSRQGHDGTSLFIQAAAADPNAADYHFNLAVSLKRHGNAGGALNELAQCLKLRPNDSEAQALVEAWKAPARQPTRTSGAKPKPDPLERIARSFDAAAFRQAAAMLDQMDAARLAALTPQRAGAEAVRAGEGISGSRAAARSGAAVSDARWPRTARVRGACRPGRGARAERRCGGARKEARTALELTPSADAYLVLAQAGSGCRTSLKQAEYRSRSSRAQALELRQNRAAQDIWMRQN